MKNELMIVGTIATLLLNGCASSLPSHPWKKSRVPIGNYDCGGYKVSLNGKGGVTHGYTYKNSRPGQQTSLVRNRDINHKTYSYSGNLSISSWGMSKPHYTKYSRQRGKIVFKMSNGEMWSIHSINDKYFLFFSSDAEKMIFNVNALECKVLNR